MGYGRGDLEWLCRLPIVAPRQRLTAGAGANGDGALRVEVRSLAAGAKQDYGEPFHDMRCNWRRWLGGLIPLLAVGLGAVHLERDAIERDLAERARRSLSEGGVHWAEVSFNGRDASLRGNATQDNEPAEAEAALRGVWGVRDVDNNAGLPPKIEPYLWSARRRGNRVRLQGYAPNRATQRVIIGMAQATLPGLEVVDRMNVARGVPPTDTWIAGLSFALKQLASLKRGEVGLEGLALSISGEAEDVEAHRALTTALKRGLPKGITLASAQIAAPVVSPYLWSAQFAGGQLVLSGHVAGEGARAELLAAASTAPPGTDIVDRMEPAEGAPQGFAKVAAALVKELVRLQSASAEMKDAALTVTGVAADEAQAQAVRAALRAVAVAPFKLNDQLRVREPKVEAKPPAPAEPEVKPAAPSPPPAVEPAGKVAAPAPQPPADPRKVEAPKVETPKVETPPSAPQAAPPPAGPAPKAAAAAPPPAAPAAAQAQAAACQERLAKIASAGRILFDSDSATLDASSFDTLDRLAKETKRCPGVRIAIQGHADVEGSTEYNQRLSVRRAQAVVAYLVKVGADAQQLEAVGFGSSRPAAPNNTMANKARNRRIEIVVRP